MKTQRVVILGSTGSIGRATLDVIAALAGQFEVAGLAAGTNSQRLAEQARHFRPAAVSLVEAAGSETLPAELPSGCKLYRGPDSAAELVRNVQADIVVNAIVGVAGLYATLAAVQTASRVAIANKEPLVVAGPLILAEAARHGTQILPIDSEHSALFQAMQGGQRDEVVRVYLTASGGPFRQWTRQRMAQATIQEALAHPTWRMGQKITVDSATMMNKALEIVEACRLFGLAPEQVLVLVHPESVIHSIVQFRDGSFLAQMSSPDMRVPISYALTYPRRMAGPAKVLDIFGLRQLNFEPPDVQRFPAIDLGYEVIRGGGTSGAVLNAANEAAVDAFLNGRISFGRIVPTVGQVLSRHRIASADSIESLLEADGWARRQTEAELGVCQGTGRPAQADQNDPAMNRIRPGA
jgi:1-deoxy-D-xylulose-5-phosphate reductoisomerase